MKQKKIVIVGGGASGLLAAILLGRQGMSVTLIEKNKSLGKKLAATGNGRCNFTNENMGAEYYFTKDRGQLETVFNQFGWKDAVKLMRELGIVSRSRDGYVYPYSNQASTIVERFLECCHIYGIRVLLEEAVEKLEKSEDIFRIKTNRQTLTADNVILACGGLACGELGGSDLGYRLAKQCSHTVTPLWPSLTGFISKGKWISKFSGVRIQGTLSVFADGKKLGENTGEIQCSKQGISGIPAFQLCHVVGEAMMQGKEVSGSIDFIPVMEKQELVSFLRKQCEHFSLQEALAGVVNSKCVNSILSRGETIDEVAEHTKNFTFPIVDTAGFEKAQVTAGGVLLSEIDVETMESKKMKGLYLTGELLDVDGICGGYNLQWAWATAYLCAKALSGGSNDTN